MFNWLRYSSSPCRRIRKHSVFTQHCATLRCWYFIVLFLSLLCHCYFYPRSLSLFSSVFLFTLFRRCDVFVSRFSVGTDNIVGWWRIFVQPSLSPLDVLPSHFLLAKIDEDVIAANKCLLMSRPNLLAADMCVVHESFSMFGLALIAFGTFESGKNFGIRTNCK